MKDVWKEILGGTPKWMLYSIFSLPVLIMIIASIAQTLKN
jgi:hypothetical protein